MSRVVTDTFDLPPPRSGYRNRPRLFPEQPYRDLLAISGVSEPVSWVQAWQARLAHLSPAPTAHPSLLWGGWLPLLERCRQLVDSGERHVLGLNGPIGAGKSTLLALIKRLGPRAGPADRGGIDRRPLSALDGAKAGHGRQSLRCAARSTRQPRSRPGPGRHRPVAPGRNAGAAPL